MQPTNAFCALLGVTGLGAFAVTSAPRTSSDLITFNAGQVAVAADVNHNFQFLADRIESLESVVQTLTLVLDALGGRTTSLEGTAADHEIRLAALEAGLSEDALAALSHIKYEPIDDGFGNMLDTIRFQSVNLQVVNGLGSTGTKNGYGNVILGYNEPGNPSGDDRTGSHTLVVGRMHNYSSVAGVVFGEGNSVLGPFGSVSGGHLNVASGSRSSISGGDHNTATKDYASVSGGTSNSATGISSWVGGGWKNTAAGTDSSVSGGAEGLAEAYESSVCGGSGNTAIGPGSCVSGGRDNTAIGDYSSVLGGELNLATADKSSVGGGYDNDSDGKWSWIGGGTENTAPGLVASVVGGWNNQASGGASLVCGGFLNSASGDQSSVCGGKDNHVTGAHDWRGGGCFFCDD